MPFPAGSCWAMSPWSLGAYFLWYWSHGGQTLAMQTWKLQLSTVNGEPPAINRLLLRYVLAWPSLLWFGVGLFWGSVRPGPPVSA
jgi:uncharacterized RDD family membrane protein YckC